MGELTDKANQNSNWLIIEKGSSVVVKYLDYRFIPSKQDPAKEIVQYRVSLDNKDKYWDNGNSGIMRYMDGVKKRSWIKISRKKWINKDMTEDKSKSSYEVMECDQSGRPVRREDLTEDDKLQQAEVEKSWDG